MPSTVELAGLAVIGVEAVALPRVVAEHDVGSHPADDLADDAPVLGRRPRARRRRSRRSAPRVAPSASAAACCSRRAARDELGEVGVGVPGALRPVGEDEQVDLGAGRGPLRERRRRSRTRCRRGARRSRARGARASRSTLTGGLRHRRAQRAAAAVASRVERREVGRHVDVEGERRDRARRGARARAAAPRPTWRRNDPGPYANANGASAGTESTGVPSSRWHGTSATIGRAPSRAKRRERRSPGGGRRARRRRRRSPSVRRCSQPAAAAASSEPGSSSTVEAELDGPVAHLGGGRHDDDRHRPGGRGDDPVGEAPRERRRGARSSSSLGEAGLAERERPDRDDDTRRRARGVRGAGP